MHYDCMELNLWQEKFHICILYDQQYLYIFIDTLHNAKVDDNSVNDACYPDNLCIYCRTANGRCM